MRRIARLAPAGLLWLAACGGGIIAQDIPSDPIAFVRQEASKGLLNLDTFREGLRIRAESLRERNARQAAGRQPPRARTSLMLLTASTGEMRPVRDAGAGTLPLDWSQDGLRLLLGRVVQPGGALQLFSWNRLTGAYNRTVPDSSSGLAALGTGPIRLASVARLLRPGGDAAFGVVVYTEGAGTSPLPAATGGTDPDIAPDGRTVLFVRPSTRVGREPVILTLELGEKEARPLGRGVSPRFSRDGRWIVFVRTRSGRSDVWLMRSDGTGKREIVASGFDDENPAVSENGAYVVYASARGQELESQLYLTRVADGAEIQLTQNGQNGRPVW